MARPNKRAAASRQSACLSVVKRRKIEESFASSFSATSGACASSNDDSSNDDSSNEQCFDDCSGSDAPSEGMFSEEEDQYPIAQPEAGWEEAEKALHGYSKTRVYKQKISYHRNKDDIKRKREEKVALKAGIPVTRRLKPVWGDISKIFNSKDSTPSSSATQSCVSEPTTQASQPFVVEPSQMESCHSPHLMAPQSTDQSLIRPFIPPNFEEAFVNRNSFEDEARDLALWLKSQKGKVTGDWLTRVECLRDLLNMQHRSSNKDNESRRKDWVQYSEALARRVDRSPRWAASLRLWERNWYETRTPPSCPRRGRHVKRQSLFFDEGVALAVREYLNTAMWRASRKGVCEAIAKHLQSETSALELMGIGDVLCESHKGKRGISERTASRWLVRLGWVYGRNKKGYCDGHERPDVVEYRQQVFCPRMEVSLSIYMEVHKH